ncbi:MAG TPA: Nudix family hydrolase [Planctomycetota bacterium]|nr:Nudix family hydrolase [Planctomycetota bacterium]
MNRVEVVAAVLQRDDGSFLLAQRPEGKVYAGYWEFPGGKVEPDETPEAALARELHEELYIDVQRAYPWITRDYDYAHAAVRLRFYRVTRWSGELHGREKQAFAWQRVDALTASPVLPANGPILRALALPAFYGVSNAGEVGTHIFLERLEAALQRGIRLVQLREKSLPEDVLHELATRVRALTRRYGARMVINGDVALAASAGADGVHLTAAQLAAASSRPDFELVGASCHDERELARAAELGIDFAVLGPLRDTASHPGARSLGWDKFKALVRDYPLPVYAIGGLGDADLEDAWSAGAHGIAAIRGAWSA